MKNDKLDADKGLAIEQFAELNKKFYDNFMSDYYLIKMDTLLNIITRTTEYQNNIESVEVELGKLKRNLGEANNNQLQEYAKLELASTYFHCLETFIRLFIAHAKISACPWLELSRLTTRRYRTALEDLSQGNFSTFNNKLSADGTVLYVLTGFEEIPRRVEQNDLENLKNWIKWASNELLENFEYNTFKHGLAVYTTTNGFNLMDKDTIKLQKHGECLEFISKSEKKERYVWNKETIFVSYDSRAAIIFTFGEMIKDILGVGKHIYAKGEHKIGWLPNHEFTREFIFNKDEEAIPGMPISIKGYKMELLYYNNLQKAGRFCSEYSCNKCFNSSTQLRTT